MILECLHAEHSLSLFRSEIWSGRCRIPKSIFLAEKAKVGWIFHIRIVLSEECSFEVLCTAWPFPHDHEQTNIVIDDSVYKGSRCSWISGHCEVLKYLGVFTIQ
jgi:hypothetical protein